MIGTILLILFLFAYPVWLLVKLARYGEGVFRPNFVRMQKKINEWTGLYYDGWLAYNRPLGKLIYYLLLLYLLGGILFIVYCLTR
jgi:hypothetical protein